MFVLCVLYSDEEFCHLVDGVICPSDEAKYSQMNCMNSNEMSGCDQRVCSTTLRERDLMNSSYSSLLSSRKLFNDSSRAISRSTELENQSQNLDVDHLCQISKGHQQMQRFSDAVDDVSGKSDFWPKFDRTEPKTSNDFQQNTASRIEFQRSETATEHFMDDAPPLTVISLTNSDLSHCLSLSVASRHAGEGNFLQNVIHEDGTDKILIDNISQPRHTASMSKENISLRSNRDILTQMDQNYNEYNLSKDFSLNSKAIVTESKCSEQSEKEKCCHENYENLRKKSPKTVMQTPHRYGHVLAWNKANGSRSGTQVSD